jgi:hypothetical protein
MCAKIGQINEPFAERFFAICPICAMGKTSHPVLAKQPRAHMLLKSNPVRSKNLFCK